jgi:flagella basal body P-ring formation protein FlgA
MNALSLSFRAAVLAALIAVPALAAPVAPPQQPPAAPVMLNANPVVTGPVLRLGDLFTNAGPAAAVVISKTPAVGQPLVLDVQALYRLARSYGLAWRPHATTERAVVERESRVVDGTALIQLAGAALADKGISGDDLSIELTTPAQGVRIPSEATASIEQLSYHPDSRQFTGIVAAVIDGSSAQRTAIAGRVFRTVAMPVVVRRVQGGEVIAADDIDWIAVRDSRVPVNAMLDAGALVGLTPKRMLRPGQPILASDVLQPLLVAKGALVTMIVETPQMQLTARGRALADGAKGDLIRVANLQSQSVVGGVVTGPGVVVVAGPGVQPAGRQ